MTRASVMLVVGALLVLSLGTVGQAGELIGIQAGHWQQTGNTGGTSGCDGDGFTTGTTEVSINRDVAQQVVSILSSRGFSAVTLSAEGAKGNWTRDGYSRDAFEVFVSLHVDNKADPNDPQKGICFPSLSGFKVAGPSDRLVNLLRSEYEDSTGFARNQNGITDRMRKYYAFSDLSASTPRAIIEMGYLSNPMELSLMNTSSGVEFMAQGIADAIDKFLQSEGPPSRAPSNVHTVKLDDGWNIVYSTLDRRISPSEIEGCDTWDGVMYKDTTGNWKESPTSQVFPLNVNAVYIHSNCTGRIAGDIQPTGSVQLSSGQWEVISSTRSWNEISGNCQLSSKIWTYVGGDWQSVSPGQRMDGFKAYYLKVAESCQTLKATGLSRSSVHGLGVSPQQPGTPLPPPPTDPPELSEPSDLQATASSGTEINLTWQDNSDGESGFQIERKYGGGSYNAIETVAENSTSYIDSGLTSGTTYCYRVRSFNSDATSDYSNESCATTGKDSGQEPPPPSEPPNGTLTLTVNGDRSISIAQGESYTFEGSGFTPHDSATLYKIALPPAERSEKVLSTTTDASGNIFIDELSVNCDTFPATHTYYAVDEASGRESNEVKLKVTSSSDCQEDTSPPSQSTNPIAAELRPFDTNNNDLIDDSEFLQITNTWIEFEIEDTVFFKAIDLWIEQRALSSLGLDTVSTQPLELKTIGLTSHDHSTSFHARGVGIASMQVDVYTLSGTRVLNQKTNGAHLRWHWKNSQGVPLANGVYLYQVTVKGPNGQIERSQIKKLMVLR